MAKTNNAAGSMFIVPHSGWLAKNKRYLSCLAMVQITIVHCWFECFTARIVRPQLLDSCSRSQVRVLSPFTPSELNERKIVFFVRFFRKHEEHLFRLHVACPALPAILSSKPWFLFCLRSTFVSTPPVLRRLRAIKFPLFPYPVYNDQVFSRPCLSTFLVPLITFLSHCTAQSGLISSAHSNLKTKESQCASRTTPSAAKENKPANGKSERNRKNENCFHYISLARCELYLYGVR